MKENQNDKKLMDYVDGISDNVPDENLRIQGEELKMIVAGLKDLPYHTISSETDKKIYQFIAEKNADPKPVIKMKSWLIFLTACTSIILFLLFLSGGNSLKEDYQKLSSNPEKLRFIYALNDQVLSSTDIEWLQEELRNENNPNIKVTIIDLLANDHMRIDQDFFNNLQKESIPTVQMALLNSLENSENEIVINELRSFSQRKDLDASVRLKANEILSN